MVKAVCAQPYIWCWYAKPSVASNGGSRGGSQTRIIRSSAPGDAIRPCPVNAGTYSEAAMKHGLPEQQMLVFSLLCLVFIAGWLAAWMVL